jgi:hypothetical protein
VVILTASPERLLILSVSIYEEVHIVAGGEDGSLFIQETTASFLVAFVQTFHSEPSDLDQQEYKKLRIRPCLSPS